MSLIEERMGPKWSTRELYIFFNGNRHSALKKYKQNWSSISQNFQDPSLAEGSEGVTDCRVLPRTEQMIESLFMKNKTYLSLPSANPRDFVAIMADHYSCLEERKKLEEAKAIDEEVKSLYNTPAPDSSMEEDETLFSKKRRPKPYESPRTPLSIRKPSRKPDTSEITSLPAEMRFLQRNKFKEGNYSRRNFPGFVYSPDIYLNDYAQQLHSYYSVSPKVLHWCKCEWFYSYIDRGFFSHNELEELMKLINLNTNENYTLYEWRVIKRMMGRPRRFSDKFVQDEKRKLYKYREAIKVLQQGRVLPSNYHDMLPYINMNIGSVSSRLMVGQKVLAIHPNTGELKSGSILTMDANKYHVQFDKPELGVCSISDTQLVPLYSPEEVRDHLRYGEITPYSQGPFIYRTQVITDRENISPQTIGERYKAGVNIYAMAFLLKLLERKEALINLLKEYNQESKDRLSHNPNWRPENDFQQQYAWICVCIQAVNTAITPVLEAFRLRTIPPANEPVSIRPFNYSQVVQSPVTKESSVDSLQMERLEQIRHAASLIVSDESVKNCSLETSEQRKLQESLRNSVGLLCAIEQYRKEKEEVQWKCVEEMLSCLVPACEANLGKYYELKGLVTSLRERVQ